MCEGTAHWAFPGRAKLTGIHPLMQRVGFPPLAAKLIDAAVPVAVLTEAHAVVWFSFSQSSGAPCKKQKRDTVVVPRLPVSGNQVGRSQRQIVSSWLPVPVICCSSFELLQQHFDLAAKLAERGFPRALSSVLSAFQRNIGGLWSIASGCCRCR
jgi:hypothetical protein